MATVTHETLAKAYRTLGLNYGELGKVKSRHRELVRDFHPDRPDGGNLRKMQEINDAKDVLERYGSCFSGDFINELGTRDGNFTASERRAGSSAQQESNMDFTVYGLGVLWPLIFFAYVMEGFLAIHSWFGP